MLYSRRKDVRQGHAGGTGSSVRKTPDIVVVGRLAGWNPLAACFRTVCLAHWSSFSFLLHHSPSSPSWPPMEAPALDLRASIMDWDESDVHLGLSQLGLPQYENQIRGPSTSTGSTPAWPSHPSQCTA